MKYLIGQKDQKQFRVVGITLFAAWCGLVLMRILMRYLPIENDLAADAAFTIPVQLGLLLALPYCSYRFALGMKPREVLEFSSVRKCPVPILLLAVPLGICVFFATIGVSTVWQSLLILLGYTHTSSASVLPEKFNGLMFVASLLLTAVLPAVCEEFSVRGGLFTVIRKAYRPEVAIVLMGVLFGLFHQNITQVFYTALFGILMAYLAYRCKSILPCMIVHFINNGSSVYLEYAEAYGWWGHNFYDWINLRLQSNPFTVVTLYVLICAVGFMLVFLIQHFSPDKPKPERRPTPEPDAPKVNVNPFEGFGLDPFAETRIINPFDASADEIVVTDAEPPAPEPAATADKPYRPSLRDGAFYIGAVTLSVLTTIFSFIWGLFY